MKRCVIFLVIMLIMPMILANEIDNSISGENMEAVQTYTTLNRFVDNVKLFFSSGDNKVRLALEIREREINSAIENVYKNNNEEMSDDLGRAWKKLQLIQERVSVNTAEEVKENSDKIRENILKEENLPEDFNVYILEEEKTGLTAEWVVEVNGKEGQTLKWEVVGEEGNRTVKIEKRIDEIDNEISNWVVEHTYAEGTGPGGESGVVVEGGLKVVVENEVATGDNGLKWEVKNSVAGVKNEVVENKIEDGGLASGTSASSSEETDHIDEGDYAEGTSADGDCGDDVICGGEGDVIENVAGDDVIDGETSEGDNEVAPAIDSNSGDESSE